MPQSFQHHPGRAEEFSVKVHSGLADAMARAGTPVTAYGSSAAGLPVFQVVGDACQTGKRNPEILGDSDKTVVLFGKIIDNHIQTVGEAVDIIGDPPAQFAVALMKDHHHQICMEKNSDRPFFLIAVAEHTLDITVPMKKG